MSSASLTQFLSARLPPPASVLDLGCGTGLRARALAAAGHRVTALDFDADALETARFLADPGEALPAFVAGDMRALPFAAERFDAVLCADVLHWSPDAAAFEAAWDEIERVLRPGGLFAARLRAREGVADPDATVWFLADRESLDARGGEWVEPPVRDGDSWAFILRKI